VPQNYHPDLDLSPGSGPRWTGGTLEASGDLRTTLLGISQDEILAFGPLTGTSRGHLLSLVGRSPEGETWVVGVADGSPPLQVAYAFLPASACGLGRGDPVELRWRAGGAPIADGIRASGPAAGRDDFIAIALALAAQADADDDPARRRVAYSSLRTMMLCAGDDVLASFLAQRDVPHSTACPRVFASAATSSTLAVRVLDQLSLHPIGGVVHDAGSGIGNRKLLHALIKSWDRRRSVETGRPTVVETLAFLDASLARRRSIGWWAILRGFGKATPWTHAVVLARLAALLSSHHFVLESVSQAGSASGFDPLTAAHITLQRPEGDVSRGRQAEEELAAKALASDLSAWAYLLRELSTRTDLAGAVERQVIPWLHTLVFPQGRTFLREGLARALGFALVAASLPERVVATASLPLFSGQVRWLESVAEPSAPLRLLGARAAGRLAGVAGAPRRVLDSRPSSRAFIGGLSESLQDGNLRTQDHDPWREAGLAAWEDPSGDRWIEMRSETLRLAGAHAVAGCETCREDLCRLARTIDGLDESARPMRVAVPLLRALLGWPGGRDAARELLVWGRVLEAWRLWLGNYSPSRLQGDDAERARHQADADRVASVLESLFGVGMLLGKSERGSASRVRALTPGALAAALVSGSPIEACEAILVSERTTEPERDAAWRVLATLAPERLDALTHGSWWLLPPGARERVARYRLRTRDGTWWVPWVEEIAGAARPDPVEVDRAVATLLTIATMLFDGNAGGAARDELRAHLDQASGKLMGAVATLVAENRGDHPRLLRDLTEIRAAVRGRGPHAAGPALTPAHADLIREALAIRLRWMGGLPEYEQPVWDSVVGAVSRLCGDEDLAALPLGPAWPGLAARKDAALANSLRGVAGRLAQSLRQVASSLEASGVDDPIDPLLALAASAAEVAEASPAVRRAVSHVAGDSTARDFLLQALREVGHMLAARNRGVLDARGAARLLDAAAAMLKSLATFADEGDRLFPILVDQIATAAGCPRVQAQGGEGTPFLASLPAGALFFMLAEIARNAAKHGGELSLRLEGAKLLVLEAGVEADRAARIRGRLARTTDTMVARGEGGQGLAMVHGFLRTARLPCFPDDIFHHEAATRTGIWTIHLRPSPNVE